MKSHLNELLFQLVDGKTLSLLQDRKLSFFSIRGLVAAKSMFFPFRDIVGHHTYAPHVGSYLPAVNCMDGERVKTGKSICYRCTKMIIDLSSYKARGHMSSRDRLFMCKPALIADIRKSDGHLQTHSMDK